MRMLVAILMIAALPSALCAQDASDLGSGKGGRGHKQTQKTDQQKTDKDKQKADEAYKAALKRIPDPKQKYDPWAITH
jgi:hypothetical protein